MASPRGNSDPSGSRETTRTLPDRVGQLYYAHGLFCSSHPVSVISFAIAIVLLCCYPLLNLPLPGNVPQQLSGNFSLLRDNVSDIGDAQLPRWFAGSPVCYVQQIVLKTAVIPWTSDLLLTDAFRAPLSEVFKLLEVILNYQLDNSTRSLSHVCLHIESAKVKYDKKVALPEYNCLVLSPANLWQQNRERFQEDSNLLGTIFTYQNLQKGKISLAEILFGMHMKDTGIKRYPLRTRQRVLQYAVTLVLKEHDPRFVEGLKQKLIDLYPLHQPHNSASPSQWQTPGDNILNMTLHPQDTDQEILHIYFPGQFNLREFVPLTVTYFILFLYMYFSVRKIELVKSKIGMAFSAVVTVLASLLMSVGMCFFFGLTLTLTGKEIFPYLVVIVGLENILVLTKSVVSTPTHLDVKIRVAQGLSREGWSITKNLLIEVTILTVGLFTFVPAIQEFCIFAVVGLLSDYFLQMLFFSTILAIDIRRMELSTESHHRFPYGPSVSSGNRVPFPQYQSHGVTNPLASKSQPRNMVRSKSHPRLNGLTSSNYPTNVVAPPNSPPVTVKVPKRLRLVHFWASTRIFQRAFMICMIVWITVIMYSSGVLEHLLKVTTDDESISGISEKESPLTQTELIGSGLGENSEAIRQYYELPATSKRSVLDNVDLNVLQSFTTEESRTVASTPVSEPKKIRGIVDKHETAEGTDAISKLKHIGYEPWRRLSHYHWPAILSLYNISLAGHYISILPPIRLSHAVTSEDARILRNPEEKAAQHFQWQALAAALDPLDFSDGVESGKVPAVGLKSPNGNIDTGEVPFVPSSPMELFLTAVLCVISIVVVAYTMVMLYRCVCSRNYAEWRASWTADGEGAAQDSMTQVVMEAVPLILDGHPQEVECLATDGNMVVSSCLGGQLRIWDSTSGETLAVVDRKFYFTAVQRNVSSGQEDFEDLPLSDYESGSPPSRGERIGVVDETTTMSLQKKHSDKYRVLWNFPDLGSTINVNFTANKSDCGLCDCHEASPGFIIGKDCSNSGFDFSSRFENLYEEHKKSLEYDLNDSIDDERNCTLSLSKRTCPTSPKSSVSQPCSASPTKRTLENPFSDNSLNLSKDTPNVTDHQIFQDGTRICDVQGSNKSVFGFKSDMEFCDKSGTRLRHTGQLLGSSLPFEGRALIKNSAPVNPHVCTSNDVTSGLVHDTCEIMSCGRSDCGTKPNYVSRSLHFDADNQCSQVNDMEIRVCEELNHNTPPVEVSGSSALGRGTMDRSHAMYYAPPIWCLDCHENLIVIGCANGRLEFWEGSTGTFKCLFEDGSGVGITAVKIIGNRVVAAKLSGSIDFLELESYSHGRQMDWGFTSYRRTHVRSGSTGSLIDWDSVMTREVTDEDIRCIRLNTTRAHQQPITVLDSEGGRVLTGSKDHTLKVFRLEDQLPLYTLHGHCGPVTCLFIDRISPMMSGSGSQDGLLCVWDLLTGACMYSIQAHDGSVTALTYSASYVISLGTDERLCVWERFQGHLLNTIQVSHTYCSSMVMFTHNLLITSKQGSLVVWDVRTGDPVRFVKLGHSDGSVFVKQILLLRDSVACDYSNQLRIVRFPLVVTNKCD